MRLPQLAVLACLAVFAAATLAAERPDESRYEERARHDPGGTGRFYMGREIARVIDPGGIRWLDRPARDATQQPDTVIAALGLRGAEVVADLGAGSGYFTFRIAPRLTSGRVIAVDIQEQMLAALRRRAAALNARNVEVVRGTETDPRLPEGAVDVVLMVDVYHELAYPFEVMTKVRRALKPEGRLVLVEYREEDPRVPVGGLHRMSEAQIRKEMAAAGFVHRRTLGELPWQHIVVFGR